MKILSIVAALTALLSPLTALAQTPTGDIYAFTRLIRPPYLAEGSTSYVRATSGGAVVGFGVVGFNFSRALRWNVDGTVTNL
ncbi:MAG: hypothetical protein H7Y38_17175, partial [Armatimonadetes bacterium]|nr:hypothetical protein [Armatimonadota bacterium]